MTTATLERPGSAILVVGAGANTEHFKEALDNVRASHPVIVGEVRPVDPDKVPYSTLHRLDQVEGRVALEAMVNNGEVGRLPEYTTSVPSSRHSNSSRTCRGWTSRLSRDY